VSCKCNFGSGLSTCHCAGCHETFTSVSAFDLHQRLDDDGLTCLDPGEMFRKDGVTRVLTVIRHTLTGDPVWGQYDPRVRQFNVGAEISGTFTHGTGQDKGVAA
jgi:hypothetical protein